MANYGNDMVHESVFEANRRYGREVKRHGVKCRCCGADSWRTRWGVSAQYASQYNPGEYCEFTCNECGYSYEMPS